MSKSPSYEVTQALLRLPWNSALVAKPIYAFGSRLEVGTVVKARPYHNDPEGYVSIRFTDEAGELHEFTESDDRIAYDPCGCTDSLHFPGQAMVGCRSRVW